MSDYLVSTKPQRTPVQQVARTANLWGWCYVVTIFSVYGATSVPPGPLRVLVLNFGVLCCIIGVLELVWRHFLLKTGEARWAKVLALNQVGGTLILCWSLYLLYQVPDAVLNAFAQKSEIWTHTLALFKTMPSGHMLTDTYVLHIWHLSKLFMVYGVGALLLLSQIWVIYHYLTFARQIEHTPNSQPIAPPVLKQS